MESSGESIEIVEQELAHESNVLRKCNDEANDRCAKASYEEGDVKCQDGQQIDGNMIQVFGHVPRTLDSGIAKEMFSKSINSAATDIVKIHHCTSIIMKSRLELFEEQAEITKKCCANANAQYPRFPCLKDIVSAILLFGVRHYEFLNDMGIVPACNSIGEAIEYRCYNGLPALVGSKCVYLHLAFSFGGATKIGELIANAMKKVGKESVITIQDGKDFLNELELVEGMKLDRSYISPYTNHKSDDPLISIHEKKISSLNAVVKVLELDLKIQKPILIVAEDVEGDALATIIRNKLRAGIKVCAIKAPELGENRKSSMQDLAVLTRGQVITIVFTRDYVAMHPTQFTSKRIGGHLKLIKQGSALFLIVADTDGKLREARMNHSKGLAVADRGNTYIAVTNNMAIQKISDTGVTTIVGGKQVHGGGHVDAPSEDAKFSNDLMWYILEVAIPSLLLIVETRQLG